MKTTTTVKRSYTINLPPPVQELVKALTVWLHRQQRDPVFCDICRVGVPDRKEFCVKCARDKRIKELLESKIRTMGQGIGMKEQYTATESDFHPSLCGAFAPVSNQRCFLRKDHSSNMHVAWNEEWEVSNVKTD